MADRVHPIQSERQSGSYQEEHNTNTTNAGSPNSEKKFEEDQNSLQPTRKSGTYVIQIPKDQIYRVPPPENAHLFETYSRRAARGRRRRNSPCCRCITWTLCILLAIIVAAAVTAAILYFVFDPKLPSYSLERIAIKGFDAKLAAALSPEFNVTVRADNPNKDIGFYYGDGGDATAAYSDMALAHGFLPVFYQGKRNVTVFEMTLNGAGIRLASSLQSSLSEQQRKGQVPLEMNVKVPVRVRFGAVTSWTMTVKIKCDVVVDELTENAKIVSKSCKTKIDVL